MSTVKMIFQFFDIKILCFNLNYIKIRAYLVLASIALVIFTLIIQVVILIVIESERMKCENTLHENNAKL